MNPDAHLAAVVRCSQDAIMSQTLEGAVATWNPAAELLYGYSADEAVGRDFELIVPPEALAEHHAAVRGAVEGEEVAHYESCHIGRDGRALEVSVTVSAIRDRSGAVVGVSVVTRDIGERKRIERELAQAHRALAERNLALERSNHDLEQFAYVASHDLSEPLRAVIGFSELLSRRYEGRLDETADRYIRHTVQGCHRMQTLIEDLLAYSRVGRKELALDELEAAAVVGDALTALSEPLDSADATVILDELPRIVGDRRLLAQVFQNLISNAVKFRNGSPPEVRVAAHRGTDDEWVFSVADNGIGIEPRHDEQIFNVFARLHDRSEYAGNGIGLAICKRVVEIHGGRIWVEATPGGGSTFCFTLPDPGEDGDG